MSTAGSEHTGDQPSEEELRAAYEAELKKIRVEHVLLEQIVTMINLGMRRTAAGRAGRSRAGSTDPRRALAASACLRPDRRSGTARAGGWALRSAARAGRGRRRPWAAAARN